MMVVIREPIRCTQCIATIANVIVNGLRHWGLPQARNSSLATPKHPNLWIRKENRDSVKLRWGGCREEFYPLRLAHLS